MTARLEQGYVLDDRYRLDEPVGEQRCAALWRGMDTVLARTVSIMVMPSEAPETARILTAARRAARIRDSRIAQVYDTANFEDNTYVITEWVSGRSLRDLLAESGPLHPDRAGALVGEAAEALTEAHRMAVSHLRLTPDNLVWTSAGGVKLTGVGTDAALDGSVSDDPARTDAEGLGALLYAALTARWPFGETGNLAAAPLNGDGAPVSPRQVRAGVPLDLDATTDRAVSQHSRRGLAPLATPAAVAEALADFPDPTPLDLFGDTQPQPATNQAPATDRIPAVAGTPFTGQQAARAQRRRRGALFAIPAGIALVAVLAVGGLRFGLAGFTGGPSGEPSATSSAPSDSATPAGKRQIPVVSAEAFDPLGDGVEHNENVARMHDGTPRTVWYSDRYNSSAFGNLKPGVGVVFDLGSPKKVDSVLLRMPDAGAQLELRSSNSTGSSVDDFDVVAKGSADDERVELQPKKGDEKARYWLVWFTELPNTSEGYRAGIGEATFRPAP
ncbi:MAG: serine/threonine protein kinase [Streptosporangiales bacterium]|nr:serine/threonine protein kinase [Streptosporangiales bacterium]